MRKRLKLVLPLFVPINRFITHFHSYRAFIFQGFVGDEVFQWVAESVYPEWISGEFTPSNKLAHQMLPKSFFSSTRISTRGEALLWQSVCNGGGKPGSGEKKPICVAPLCSYAVLRSDSQGQSPGNRRHASVKLEVDLKSWRVFFFPRSHRW